MTELDPSVLIGKIPEPFRSDILSLTQTIRNAGGECYVVGGSVRDLVLNVKPEEFDLTTSLLPERILSLFKRTVPTGLKHGTVTVLFHDRAYEITTFRKDADYVDGRRPESVEFGVSLSEDLKRRDFTMNALALDLERKLLIDEHDGIKDIQNQIIRTIGDPIGRFTEDGLRPIRALRFVSSLGFSLDPHTAEAIHACRNITAKVSRERVHDELNKTLKSKDPFPSLQLFKKFQILELFTNVALYPKENEPAAERMKEIPAFPLSLRLTFLHAWLFGSFAVGPHSKQFLKDLRYSNHNTKDSLFFAGILYEILAWKEKKEISDAEIRKILLHPTCVHATRENLLIVLEHILKLCFVYEPSLRSVLHSSRVLALAKDSQALLVTELAVRGEDILKHRPQLPPKEIGGILSSLLTYVLENPLENRKEILLQRIPV
ncbi:CCA tRNA nucleotidyltransferase [Leptospira stimsonii]|uniref:[cytidine(C)-cytidine(C)-adenosine (A)]-adding enzyme n=1 Tax=Leptospira stimsonii TaxID=2202203 RepID=A0ABY2MY81_9LEPT|nr:[cytidine(C)-cytidine(C)-adenosine (A)]-adding enzyme [Leptospira stimsonii]TGK14388.1 [cytidine(C)-cytidine(C)-adenosine (A)]-adding enzyme [Leptospira stimsonii]TGM11751.1 [cytidine(C)-cytidine(C)-adenosine (A)]-adding enzyme [Leptospira stimsonii]